MYTIGVYKAVYRDFSGNCTESMDTVYREDSDVILVDSWSTPCISRVSRLPLECTKAAPHFSDMDSMSTPVYIELLVTLEEGASPLLL